MKAVICKFNLIFAFSLFAHFSLIAQIPTLQISSPPELAGEYDCSITVDWGGSTCNFDGIIAFAFDDTMLLTDACGPIASNVSGSIALIDRGLCNFGQKAINAQNAGAIGAIICNNDTTNPDDVINMGAGVDVGNVTIPVKMLSFNTCQAIRAYTGGEPIEILANEATHGNLAIKAVTQ